MKTLKITEAEEKWLKKTLQEDIDAFEEWEEEPSTLGPEERKELEMLRKFAVEFEERITE